MDPSIAALLSKLNPATLTAVERRNLDVSDSLSQLAPLLKNPEVVATVRRVSLLFQHDPTVTYALQVAFGTT
jgi:hypothetical protein